MSGALAGRKEEELDKGRVGATKVKRYWPGKAPDWVDENDEEPDIVAPAPVTKTDVAAPVILHRSDDPRLRRLAQRQQQQDEDESEDEEDDADRRGIIQPTIVRRRGRDESEEEQEGSEEEEEDDEVIERRRAAMREKLKARQEEVVLAEVQEEEDEEEESSSEYETDDSEDYGRPLMKPLFVPKTERETIEERERLEQEEELHIEKEKQRKQERQKETRELVVDIIKAEATHKVMEDAPVSIDDVNTDDEIDEEAEYEAWKTREMRRIKRDREERERELQEAVEKEKWRTMSEAERLKWLVENPKNADKGSKTKWKFLQKYWHKGAFFQEDADDTFGTAGRDSVLARDYSAPTGDDVMDKTILPKIMQVKNFGRRGRTKWQHLVAEDTTSWDNPWMTNDTGRTKYNKKMAAMEGTFDKPKHLKR